MKKTIFFCSIFLICTQLKTYSQKNDFDGVVNKLFFNIFLNKPDSTIKFFLSKYYPAYNQHPDSVNWGIYPFDTSFHSVQKTIHTFIFNKHPFFDLKFTEGRLELLSFEYENMLPRISQPQLLFLFESKLEANKVMGIINNLFNEATIIKKTITQKESIELHIVKPSPESSSCIQLILFKDPLKIHCYQILLRLGCIDE